MTAATPDNAEVRGWRGGGRREGGRPSGTLVRKRERGTR